MSEQKDFGSESGGTRERQPMRDSVPGISEGSEVTRISEKERTVLLALIERGCEEDSGFCGFAPLCEDTKLERKEVRRACRSLARKGLTKFARGLWNDDGEPGGSGYAATRTGVAFLSATTSDRLAPNEESAEQKTVVVP